MGSLPGDLKSHILKTMHYDHLGKGDRQPLPSEGVVSDGLNKIRELPEEYEKLPRNARGKPQTQKDEMEEHKQITMEALIEDSFDQDVADHAGAPDKST